MALDFSGFIPFQRGNMDNQFGDRALDLWNTLKGRLGINEAPMQVQPSNPLSAKDYVLEQFGGNMQNYNDWLGGLNGDKPTNWEQAKEKLTSNTWQETSSWSNPSREPTKSYGKSEPDNLLAAAMPDKTPSGYMNVNGTVIPERTTKPFTEQDAQEVYASENSTLPADWTAFAQLREQQKRDGTGPFAKRDYKPSAVQDMFRSGARDNVVGEDFVEDPYTPNSLSPMNVAMMNMMNMDEMRY